MLDLNLRAIPHSVMRVTDIYSFLVRRRNEQLLISRRNSSNVIVLEIIGRAQRFGIIYIRLLSTVAAAISDG